jgi:rubredoxin---NAD+ reductase
MQPVIIIGTGIAGYSVAREFRKLDKETPLIILTEDDGCSYYKPVLSNALTSNKTPETIPLADAQQMGVQLNADIRPFTPVAGCNPDDRTIVVGNETIDYQHLVFAVGADPIHVPTGGDAADRIFSVNNLADYRRFRAAIEEARTIAIMGAGLIGCEFANDLPKAGIEVHVIDPAPFPLNRFLPERAARTLQTKLSEIGVEWHLDCVVESVDHDDERLRVSLSAKRAIEADAVLSAIGLRPRTRLASACGLAVNRGIVVDAHLRTSDPNIYALGDCAEVEGLVLPFVMPIMHAARALAKTLAGEPTKVTYPAMPVVVKTTYYPVVVAPPKPGIEGDWKIREQEDGIEALFYDHEKTLQGFALTGSAVSQKNALAKALPPVLVP